MATGKEVTISYNPIERGFRHNGQDRSKQLDMKALFDSINSESLQERVKTNAMTGFFGHTVRQLLGLTPPDSAILDGKVVPIIPAIVTKKIKMDSNGTITHTTAFLDSDDGQFAQKLYEQGVGGFSSAIDLKMGFHGFDYTRTPNNINNSTHEYILDSAENVALAEFLTSRESERIELMDALIHELSVKNDNLGSQIALYDSNAQAYDGRIQLLSSEISKKDSLCEQLKSQLEKLSQANKQANERLMVLTRAKSAGQAVFDSANENAKRIADKAKNLEPLLGEEERSAISDLSSISSLFQGR